MRIHKRHRIPALVLCAALLLSALPMSAYAADQDLSKTIDLNSTKNLKGAGYSWNASTHTLTLSDADLRATDKPIFLLDKTESVKIVLKGENRLSCEGAAAIAGSGKKGEKLTFSGKGSLDIEGYVDVYSSGITIANCALSIAPGEKTKGSARSFNNGGKGDFLVTGGARVNLKNGLNTGSSSDNLIVNGAYLTVESNTFGPTVEVSDKVILKNGGELRAYNAYESALGYSRFSNALYSIRGLDADETSTIEAISQSGAAVKVVLGDCRLESQDIHLQGNKQAMIIQQSALPKMILPTDENWTYTAKAGKADDVEIYAATLCEKAGETVTYDYLQEEMTGGTAEVAYMSTAVERAKSRMDNAILEAESEAYVKTEGKSRRIKIWWQSTDPDDDKMTGYEIARASSEDGPFKPIYTTTKYSYTNTSGLVKGEKYYYRVRAYIQVNDTLYYSDWSNVTGKTAK